MNSRAVGSKRTASSTLLLTDGHEPPSDQQKRQKYSHPPNILFSSTEMSAPPPVPTSKIKSELTDLISPVLLRWSNPPSFAPSAGPLPNSNWLIPGRLCCGGHPTTNCFDQPGATLAVQKLIQAGIKVIVNFQEPREAALFQPYQAGVQAAGIEIVSFPIRDRSVPEFLPETIQFIGNVITKLRSGSCVYLHCFGGHGRTGTIAALLLATIYQWTAQQALDAVMQAHLMRPFEGQKLSPESEQQRQFVQSTIETIRLIDTPAMAKKQEVAEIHSGSSTAGSITGSTPKAFLIHPPPTLATIETARGPTVLSNWVFTDKLCVGGYPSAAETTKAHVYAQSMSEARFDTYVNLMRTDELKRFRTYADLIAYRSSKLDPPLNIHPPEFIHFPIEDGGLPEDDQQFIGLIYELIQRIRAGRKVYSHCWGGHGRTGTLVSVLIAVLNPALSAQEAMDICQRLHSCREYNGGHLSPEPTQKPFVIKIVDLIRSLPSSYSPPSSFKLQHLPYQPYQPISAPDSPELLADGPSRGPTKREKRLAELAASMKRAGGGEGVIVVDSHGTASTTQALNSVPSTPLMSPHRRISREPIPLEVPDMLDGLLQREMISDSSHLVATTSASPSLPPFRLLQMNTLADFLCNAESFPNTAAAALDWNIRKHMLLEELCGSNRIKGDIGPQIICLQECDHYADWFQPELAKRGYSQSFFHKKQSDFNKDGVAVFVQDGSFQVKQHECITLAGMNQVLILLQLIPLNDDEEVNTNEQHRLYVATTHLKAKEGFELLRLKQVQLITQYIQQFIHKHHASSFDSHSSTGAAPSTNPPHSSLAFTVPSHAAIIFAGDFNDTPHSMMYDFIASGSSDVDMNQSVIKKKPHPPVPVEPSPDPSTSSSTTTRNTNTTPMEIDATLSPPTILTPPPHPRPDPVPPTPSIPSPPIRHPFWFHSLYNRYYDPTHPANHPGKLYTTVKHRAKLVQRCIDYIWYTPQVLHPTGMLNIPNLNIHLDNYLPAVNYPSDHLAIEGRFEWK